MADPHSISENAAGYPSTWDDSDDVPKLYGPDKVALLIAAREKLGWTRHGRTAGLTEVCDEAARLLGKNWRTKLQGYQILVEFTGYTYQPNPVTSRLKKSCHKKKAGKAKKGNAIVAVSSGADVRSDEFLSSYEWRRLRMVVIKKRSPRCECCGATPADGHTVINVDHIKPRKLHPELALEESNLQILCHVCNHGKGNWDETDWRDWQPPEMYEPIWNSTTVKPEPVAPTLNPGLPRLVKAKAS